MSDNINSLGLNKLPQHLPALIATTIACHVISVLVTRWLFPRYLKRFLTTSATAESFLSVQMGIQVVCMLHSIVASCLAVSLYRDPVLRSDKLFGYTYRAGQICAITCGYFLWDLLVSLKYVRHYGVGFVLHAAFCLLVFLFGFGPFGLWYGSVFLAFEMSTPFLYINWFMDKFGLTGSIWQAINGAILVTLFTGVRLVWGSWMSAEFFRDILFDSGHLVPIGYKLLYATANACLMSLNVVWLWKILRAFRRRRLFLWAKHWDN